MTKQKWYKSKGGWIGLVLAIILLFLLSGRDYNILLIIIGLGEYIAKNIGFAGEQNLGVQLLLQGIYGFFLGYFTEKLIKKRRR